MKALNGVMMQYFHWYSPGDGTLWDDAAARAGELAAAGFTGVWLPPAYKGMGGGYDVGYGVYDMYDLGEFDQKGSVRTKYGTKQQYLSAVRALQKAGIQVYADTVLNHRIGGDATELVRATPFPQDDRLRPKGEPREIEAYTHFRFGGRNGRYSAFEWRARHFDAVDYDHRNPGEKNTVYLIDGKKFDDQVALENGNFSYLMGADLDFDSQEVRDEVTAWGKWYLDTTGVDGFRLDAVKHIAAWFFPEWLDAMESPREEGPVRRRRVLDAGHRRAALVSRPPRRPHLGVRRAAPLPLPPREQGVRQLRHAPPARGHADAAARHATRSPSSRTTTRSRCSRSSRWWSPGSSRSPTRSSCCGARATRACSTPTTTAPSTRTGAGTATATGS